MQLATRSLLDKCFTALCIFCVGLMVIMLLVLLVPIVYRGANAYLFTGTIEHRQVMLDLFERGDKEAFAEERQKYDQHVQPVFAAIQSFEHQLEEGKIETREISFREKRDLKSSLEEVKEKLHALLGPLPGEEEGLMARTKYGQTRWDRTLVKRDELIQKVAWVPNPDDPSGMLVKTLVPRKNEFAGTALAPMFDYLSDDENLAQIMQPRLTFYWQFLFDESTDAHFFGGIWPEMLGTLYLTIGSMIFAIPMGIIAAIYLVEYAKEGPVISLIRTCISTLAGVPSIVFGLFGLSFFINTIGSDWGFKLMETKSMLAGSLTLALLVLPTIIRAAEEAIRAVPNTYREAAIGLGSTRWNAVVTVILPAALPGILTGIVISMGRAAGETAPIIFTAAVSVGQPLGVVELFTDPGSVLSSPTPALSWNIYNICTEHESVEEIRHVQFGMVFTLVAMVLCLNATAIYLRARISKKLKG